VNDLESMGPAYTIAKLTPPTDLPVSVKKKRGRKSNTCSQLTEVSQGSASIGAGLLS